MNRLFTSGLAVLLVAGLNSNGQDWARARLAKSPRHLEWVDVKHNGRVVRCFVAYPQGTAKKTAVVLVHELFGLSDWTREVADQLAEAGFLAIAPDLLSGSGPDAGGSAAIKDTTDLNTAVASLTPERVNADLNAVVRYVEQLPAANGKVTAVGFSWGGSEAFRLATNTQDLNAAFVFYGTAPGQEQEFVRIKCPVYGFYAELDHPVDRTVPQTREWMEKAGKTFEPVTYTNSNRAFMRCGSMPNATGPNKDAHDEAWKRLTDLLKKI